MEVSTPLKKKTIPLLEDVLGHSSDLKGFEHIPGFFLTIPNNPILAFKSVVEIETFVQKIKRNFNFTIIDNRGTWPKQHELHYYEGYIHPDSKSSLNTKYLIPDVVFCS
ncbi:MAG: hypothetical protein COB67_02420 [SAR324 cluster bacterium]|uniref:Uncharacterized protein n=1 Tax=SAR324 cluster bacterium TaxID=2024889 RepID=A0A2A4TA13_9DELT|nr:MAG: hypothetical protein COB67_02420 [SAR324 cluster bacterium]